MSPFYFAAAFAVGLFLFMVVLFELGRRIALRVGSKDLVKAHEGTGIVDGAVFGLLGLLLAFTFSGAASRFDDRRELVVQEANDIGTAWLRLNLVSADHQTALRDMLRQYLDARLDFYSKLEDRDYTAAAKNRVNDLQSKIWQRAVIACNETKDTSASMLLLPALNDMFDIATKRVVALQIHPPLVIFGMLVVLVLAGALLAGYGLASDDGRKWLHVLSFSLIMSVSIYLIFDLEYPRLGLIRIDAIDQVLVQLRASIK